jgi:Mycobacterium membrane protein
VGGGYPTYQPGSAPVPQPAYPPPGYPPVTEPLVYAEAPARRSRRPVVAVAATLVALAVCGLVGVAGFVLLGNHTSGTASQPVAVAPSQAPSHAPGQAIPTDFPSVFPLPSLFPLPGGPDDLPHDIVYGVTGAAETATVVYLGADHAAVETEQVNLPWRRETTPGTGMVATTLTAFSPMGKTISCRISVDGQQVAADTDDAMVVCIGMVR